VKEMALIADRYSSGQLVCKMIRQL